MIGSPRCLVSSSSALSCLPTGASSDHAISLSRTHSDLVKFAYLDTEYDKVANALRKLCHRGLERQAPNTGRRR